MGQIASRSLIAGVGQPLPEHGVAEQLEDCVRERSGLSDGVEQGLLFILHDLGEAEGVRCDDGAAAAIWASSFAGVQKSGTKADPCAAFLRALAALPDESPQPGEVSGAEAARAYNASTERQR